MTEPGPDSPDWRKSSYSLGENDCVEFAPTPDVIHVRDSKNKLGPKLAVTPEQWAHFTEFAAAQPVDHIEG